MAPSAANTESKTLSRVQAIQKHFGVRSGKGRLDGKVCVITGAGSMKGIGRASAILFAKEGAKHLYLLDFSAENLPALAKHLTSTYPGVGVTTIEADAADEDAISGVCQQAVDEQGHLDVFFANAGVATALPIAHTEASSVTDVLRINTLSCFLAIKHASSHMSSQPTGGSIVLTASVAGLRSGAGSLDYSASKAAVISMAYTGANGLAGTGVRVNAVCPGLIETGMTEPVFDMARQRGTGGKVGQLCPLRRYGVAEEVAQVVGFLASDDASYVNGIAMPVDGGLSSSHPVVPGKMS